jgi:hypothetical protein
MSNIASPNIAMGLSTRDVGRSLDSLQPYVKPSDGQKCVVRGCRKRPRVRVYYGSTRGHQNLVGVCPEHACDIVNDYIDKTHEQGERRGA